MGSKENHYSFAFIFNSIGLLNLDLGKLAIALEYFQKSHKIKISSWGEDGHLSIANSYSNLGSTYK